VNTATPGIRRRVLAARTTGPGPPSFTEDFPAPSSRALPDRGFSRTLKGMEVHFTPEQEMQLSQIASYAGTDPERLVKEAALRLLQEEARFRAAVREGIAQADRGEFIDEEEMDARLEQMLRS
jgi:predicted transcriptional regulator